MAVIGDYGEEGELAAVYSADGQLIGFVSKQVYRDYMDEVNEMGGLEMIVDGDVYGYPGKRIYMILEVEGRHENENEEEEEY